MDILIPKKEVTLDSIAKSIGLLATKAELKGVSNIIATMATRDQLKDVEQQVRDLRSDMTKQSSSFKSRLDGLTFSMDELPTRKEFKQMDGHIDDLAIIVKGEFDRVYVRLDEMDKSLVLINDKVTGVQNQIDTIYNDYPNRSEFVFVDKRLKKLEKGAFA